MLLLAISKVQLVYVVTNLDATDYFKSCYTVLNYLRSKYLVLKLLSSIPSLSSLVMIVAIGEVQYILLNAKLSYIIHIGMSFAWYFMIW